MRNMIRTFKRQTSMDKVVYLSIGILIALMLVVVIYPLVYVVIASFMDPTKLLNDGLSFNPADYSIESYRIIMKDSSIMRGFLMSLFYSTAYAFIVVIATLTIAYPLSLKDFVGKKLLMTLIIITMFFGGGLIPTYLLLKNIGLLNTVWAVLLPGALGAWNVLLAKTFFEGLPSELREAAEIDGATHFQYFIKIVLPLSKPIIAVLALYAFVGQWNSYFDAMIYLEKQDLQPLQVVLRRILVQNQVPPGMISAQQQMIELKKIAEMIKYSSIVLASLPLLLMYPFFSKYFEKGVMIGSVKG